MRITTIFSIAVLGVSTAALAQVTSPAPQSQANAAATNASPANEVVEDKVPPANMMDTPSGNAADSAPPPGEPEAATSAPPRG